jgi:hypothetical protein
LSLPSYTPLNTGNRQADTANIQAILNKGGLVLLGPGRHYVDGLVMNGKCGIKGHGKGKTYLSGDTATIIQINSGVGIETQDVVLEDLTIDGENRSAYGITLGQGSISPLTGTGTFNRIEIARCTTAGVRLLFTALTRWFDCTFRSNRDGIWSDPTYENGATGQWFWGCRFVSNTKRGVFCEQFDTWAFWGCQAEDNGEEGMLFRHPGTATAVTRGLVIDSGCYIEDNGTSGAYADIRFDNLSTQSLQNVAVRRVRFQGVNPDGNIWVGKCNGIEEDNEFSPVSTSNVIVSNSTVAFWYARSYRTPTTYYTVGANSPVVAEQRGGDGTVRIYFNVSGTLTKVHEWGTGSKLGFFGATAIAKPTVVAGDITSIETALINLGLVKY